MLAYVQARGAEARAWRYLCVCRVWVLVDGCAFGVHWFHVVLAMQLWKRRYGLAPVTGVYGLSVLVALMSGALALFVISIQQRRSRTYAMSLVVLLAPGLIGYALKQQVWTQHIDQPISVAIVQGAVPQQMKWSEEQHAATLNLSKSCARGTQLIGWPGPRARWAESLGSTCRIFVN